LYDSSTVFAVLITTLLLAEAPVDAPRRTAPKLTWRLSIGSFIGSAWAAQSFRDNVDRFRNEAVNGLQNHDSLFESQYFLYTAPVLGPWMTLARGGQQAREDM